MAGCGQVLAALQSARNSRELLTNAQLRESGMIVDHAHPDWGTLRVPGCPIRMDGFEPRVEPAPRLGEHTAEVLAELEGDSRIATRRPLRR